MRLVKKIANSIGWSTKRKILVIESDDWGSIRMPSNQVRDKLIDLGLDLDKGLESYRYSLFDTLSTQDDLNALFESLGKFQDINGNCPVITALALVANPDFEKIAASDFSQYHFESIEKTFSKYGLDRSIDLWKEGTDNSFFVPEFHGREHLNVAAWMRRLKSGEKHTRLAFDHGIWAVQVNDLDINYQASYDLEFPEDLDGQKAIVESGLKLFETLFDRKARFFVPPNGPINNEILDKSAINGVEYVSTSKFHKEVHGNGKIKREINWLGKKNKFHQYYLTRNCFFEPSDPSKNWVDSCLSDIQLAFDYRKPAVISTHRVNYVGALSEENRKNGLNQLNQLLSESLKKWPDIEFMTSVQLGDIIQRSKTGKK